MGGSSYRIGVIGLGYVGLPLAVEFSKYYPVVGFDINQRRIDELKQCHDFTLEVEEKALRSVLRDGVPEVGCNGLFFSNSLDDLKGCNAYFITVTTPVDKNNRHQLTPLYKTIETAAK